MDPMARALDRRRRTSLRCSTRANRFPAAYPVGQHVNNPRNDDPLAMERVPPSDAPPRGLFGKTA